MAATVLNVRVRVEPQQHRNHLEATRAGGEMQKCSSEKTARREGGLILYGIAYKVNHSGAA